MGPRKKNSAERQRTIHAHAIAVRWLLLSCSHGFFASSSFSCFWVYRFMTSIVRLQAMNILEYTLFFFFNFKIYFNAYKHAQLKIKCGRVGDMRRRRNGKSMVVVVSVLVVVDAERRNNRINKRA